MGEDISEIPTHLMINWINIEDDVILVGATDNLRWQWEVEDGNSGSDAASIVYVTLTDKGKGRATEEKAGFHAWPGDQSRRLAMTYLYELFDVAWQIKNHALLFEQAFEQYFGMKISEINP